MTSKHQFDGQGVKLGDVATYINGYAFKPADYSLNGKQIIRIQDLTGNAYQTNNFAGELDDKYLVSSGDVLISWSASLGVFEWNKEEAWLNQHIFKVVFNKLPVDKRYFIHQARYVINRGAMLAHGATMRHLTKKVFESLPFSYPNRSEQLTIAKRLDDIQGEIDLAEKQISKLDSLVKSRFVEMFDGTSFPIKRLEDVAEIQGGLTKNKRRDSLALKLPYLRVANALKSGIDTSEMKSIGLTEQEYEATKLMKDDLLFVEGNGSSDQIGRSAIWDGEIDFCVHQNHLIRARFGESVLPAFAQAYFSSSAGRDQIISRAVSTSGLMTLSTGKIKSLRIPVPSLELQGSFVDFAAQVDKSRFAGTFTGTINVKNYAISCSVHNNSGRIPNEALHSAREVTEYALLELQELYDSLTQKYFAL